MNQKVILIINISILVLIVISVALLIIYSQGGQKKTEECIPSSSLIHLNYDACFDSSLNLLILKISRSTDTYSLEKIEIMLSDIITLYDVPKTSETKEYRLDLYENLETIKAAAYITSKLNICNDASTVLLKNCKYEDINQEVYVNLFFNTTSGEVIGGSPGDTTSERTDILGSNLIEEERIFDPKCKSEWNCMGWEQCIDNIQRRNCIDENNCAIPTDAPDFTKNCNQDCWEDWICKWGNCEGGFTIPVCTDTNKCGKEYQKPGKLSCIKQNEEACKPNIKCTDWTECSINYKFENLISSIENLKGTKKRVCHDENSCVKNIEEIKECSLIHDIYFKEVVINGKKYLEIYDRLTNALLARIDYPSPDKLNLDFN